jgi:hypothetical protein
MLLQVNYFGSIFWPDAESLLWMQNTINLFCKKNLNIAEEKLYALPSEGGLGLINLKDSLVAQQAIWI